MKLNYLVVFNGQVMTCSFQMGNLQKMKGTIMPFGHHYRNDMQNKRLINDGSKEVNIRPITLLAVSLDNFLSLL
jgi:hypothetical protein